MKLEIYPVFKEEEYDAIAESLDKLAVALAHVQSGKKPANSEENYIAAREMIYFLRNLIYKINY